MKYKKIEEKFLPDINSTGTIYVHEKSGARIITIKNDDPNKVFAIAFKTPPMDSTGLTHILEHSVLCGSKKFPVKDPFVELIKGSLNTFLNAFTFPDKTMYPIASLNEKDFKNLMEVYMDSVFYPAIYDHEEIFLQEGWHFEITDENEPLTYNGVVYNEMKGAFSSPDDVLGRETKKSLYPDNCYGFESGGDPKNIPDLTYEKFKEFHKKYYHPSNSYIYLAGDMDFEERLEWLDKEYLSKFDKIDFDTTINLQAAFKEPKYLSSYYPVSENEDLADKTFLTYNVSVSTLLDVKTSLAIEILDSILFNNPGAPVKEALINAGIGDEVFSSFTDIYQPYVSITAKNANKSDEEKFIQIINDTLYNIVKNGINKEDVISQISFNEFKLRESNFEGLPAGILFAMNSLNSLLHDDSKPFEYLDSLKYYDEIKKDVNEGYFEDLIEKYILNNPHKTYLALEPSKTVAKEDENKLNERLAQIKNGLSHDELLALIEKNKSLHEYQETPSTKEELDTIPKLSINDINKEPRKYHLTEESLDGLKLYWSDYFTNGISYGTVLFNLNHFSLEELQYAKLISILIGVVNTKKHSYADIHRLLLMKTGGIFNDIKISSDVHDKDKFDIYFGWKFSALNHNFDFAINMILEEMFASDYNDTKRILDIIKEHRSELEAGVASSGHAYAVMKAGSYRTKKDYINENLNGLGFLDFLNDFIKNFNKNKKKISSYLDEISHKIFNKNKVLFHITCERKAIETVKEAYRSFVSELDSAAPAESVIEFTPSNHKVAIKTPYDVNFDVLVGNIDLSKFTNAYQVGANILRMEYLWQVIRVKGGAYGAMFNLLPTGEAVFASYRDPNIESTYEAYNNVPKFLESFKLTDEELEKFIIGAFSGVDDAPHRSVLGKRALEGVLTNLTYEDRCKNRLQMLSCKVEDINNFGKAMESVLSNNTIVTIGNENKIEAAKNLFDEVTEL